MLWGRPRALWETFFVGVEFGPPLEEKGRYFHSDKALFVDGAESYEVVWDPVLKSDPKDGIQLQKVTENEGGVVPLLLLELNKL